MLRRRNLLVSCRQGDFEFLKLYVQHNTRRDAYEVYDNHHYGPLHHAVTSQSLPCVELLLSSRYANKRACTFEGYSCLFVAIISGASNEMLQLLLHYDPGLFNIPNNEEVYPIHKAILLGSCRMVEAMVSKLQAMDIPIPEQVDLDDENALFLTVRTRQMDILLYLLEHLQFDYQKTNALMFNALKTTLIPVDRGDQLPNVDNSDHTALQMIKVLFPLTYDRNAYDLIKDEVVGILATCCLFKNELVYNWLIEEFYLVNSNEHSALVARLLEAVARISTHSELKCGIRMIVAGLHSKMPKYVPTVYDHSEELYKNIIPSFQILFDLDENLFLDMFHAIRENTGSIHWGCLSIPEDVFISPDLAEKTIHILKIIDIGSLCDVEGIIRSGTTLTFVCNALLLLMPFSSVVSPYKILQCYRPPTTEEDVILSKYDLSFTFPQKICLMSMCRSVIRRCILEDINVSMADKIERFKSLRLPSATFNFLLYNYTGYNFE